VKDAVKVIGAGLAGCEAAWQCARRGLPVELYEQKPVFRSPAHHYDGFAELVCSNSLKSDAPDTAAGLLKMELRAFGSLIIQAAEATRVAAGSALAVDRQAFSDYITEKIHSHPKITVITGEVKSIPDGRVIIATGPLTSGPLAAEIEKKLGRGSLAFYDAAAPLIAADSIDMSRAFFGSRYGKGAPDYINCPLEKEEYLAFWRELCAAEQAEVHGFEDFRVFEGCMPVEVMARRGEDTLRFGSMRPVGLYNPETGKRPYAVCQLRCDNAAKSVYNMVGFQTHLKFSEQKRVFSMIPALAHAEFLRYGVMHRNSFIDSPRLLDLHFRLRSEPRISFAGQITGVEGYVESAMSGLLAGACAAFEVLQGREPASLPKTTVSGALAAYISDPSVADFQPMNANFGVVEQGELANLKKKERAEAMVKRGIAAARGSEYAV
jgi:methylenetetrahydrofolate--tRNA-(uracil-5-)-methyltransferase